MKIVYFGIFILILTACGIDKESPSVSLPSTNTTGELDLTFNNIGFLTINNSAGGNSNDEINAMKIDSQDRIVAVGASINGSGNYDMTVWRLTSSGAIDTSFASGGVFVLDSIAGGLDTDVAYSVDLDSSDNLYITGTSYNGADFDMFVVKLTSSGVLDTSFNGTGVFVDHNAAGGTGVHDQGSSIHVGASGGIFVTGFSDSSTTNRDMAIWKLNGAGALDTSFNGTGIFIHDSAAGGEDDNGNSIKTDSAGNVYVVGRSDSLSNSGDMAIWKLTSSGNLDTSFNDSGIFTHDGAAGGNDFDFAKQFVFHNGKLVITGTSRNGDGNNDMVIWRVLSSGDLDTTFNSTGYASFDVSNVTGGATNDNGEDIVIDSDEKIVVSGNGNADMCLWRYNEDGSVDTSFNTDGFFSHDSAAGGYAIDAGPTLVEDSSNRIYVGGFSENLSGDFDATFWRIK